MFPPIPCSGIEDGVFANRVYVKRWLPAIIHAWYVMSVANSRHERANMGMVLVDRAPFVFSARVQAGNTGHGKEMERR